ncbi:MAG TPA: DmsC/YnfH family molybdoenzyme membrane anchor subunit [Burkholderiales bacterium]|nr:DmsC/YnfH family molybdoenzyme membrane anchor subunit [Burkholderiales bacterium]
MHPAFSVIFLTTLIGAGQGLFLALLAQALGARFAVWGALPDPFVARAAALALALLVAGLAASFFHLGRPLRAWRSAAQWRSSWLSREVIVLPVLMALVALYGFAHLEAGGVLRAQLAWIGLLGALACVALYVCTGMIYACLRFLQEWATPLTVVNFTVLGAASGFSLAAALARIDGLAAATGFALAALALTALGLFGRGTALLRNARLRHKSTLATAIGVKHPKIEQRAAGFLGGSFNTREFFHGRSAAFLRAVKWAFLGAAFGLPLALLAAGLAQGALVWFVAAPLVQWAGLLAERWYFFAEANHPQNLYYRALA